MKIAFVGKGGSGKSSTSWAVIKHLESLNKNILTVDADHNMDLTSLFGLDYENMPLMYKFDKEFASMLEIEHDKPWSKLLTEKDSNHFPSFNIFPFDDFSKKFTNKVSDNLYLANVGLGDPEAIHYGKCAHGLSLALKFYLGMLKEGDNFVIIDSVAGVDMINFGLYSSIDAVISVVEPHINSVKVFKQIRDLCKKTGTPFYYIINKPADNDLYKELKNESNILNQSGKSILLGEIPVDTNIINYNYETLSLDTKKSLENICENIYKIQKHGNINTMKKFHEMKTGTHIQN